MKDLYQRLEMEVVVFNGQDIVTLSDNVAEDIFTPRQKGYGFTTDEEIFN